MQLNYKYYRGAPMTFTTRARSLHGLSRTLGLLGVLSLSACPGGGGDGDDHGHDTGHDHGESEIITTVTLTFTPQGGGDAVVAAFSDPDGAGGVSGMAEPIVLTAGTTYDLAVAFTNELGSPAEDITAEVEEEAESHQIFITGTGVSGPAAGDDPSAVVVQAYADTESTYGADTDGADLPVGLAHTITAAAAGAGTFSVQLQHMPPLNGEALKVAGLAEQLAMGMPLPGDTDAAVEFELTVQ